MKDFSVSVAHAFGKLRKKEKKERGFYCIQDTVRLRIRYSFLHIQMYKHII